MFGILWGGGDSDHVFVLDKMIKQTCLVSSYHAIRIMLFEVGIL